jgi:hypothetical protein
MSLTTVDAGLLNTQAQYTGFKNRIINGAMTIAQRGTTATLAYPGGFVSGTTYCSVDRFAIYCTNATTTLAQSTSAPAGFVNSIQLQRPNGVTGTNSLSMYQQIESKNVYDLASQTVTLSFWAKAGANYSGGALTVLMQTGTVADQSLASSHTWTGYSTPIYTTQAITTTWTRYTFTGTFGAGVLEANVGIIWTPSGTAGADDSVYITGMQVEKGSTATSFDYRPYGTELMLCQRYYQKTYDYGTAIGTASKIASDSTDGNGVVSFIGEGAAFFYRNGDSSGITTTSWLRVQATASAEL